MKKNWITIALAVLLAISIGFNIALAMNGGRLTPKPKSDMRKLLEEYQRGKPLPTPKGKAK